MSTRDPLVLALISLCNAEGGPDYVADKAKLSAENLRQIIKGVKLPSGHMRGVGPTLRNRITEAYPHWLDPKPVAAPVAGLKCSLEAAVVVRMIDRHADPDRRLDLMTACVNAISQFESRPPSISEPDPSGASETSASKSRA